MGKLSSWFEGPQRRRNDRGNGQKFHAILTVELLEPRQMTAGDVIGEFTVTIDIPFELIGYAAEVGDASRDQVIGPLPAETADFGDEAGDMEAVRRIYLEEIVREIGEAFDLEVETEDWWF